MIRRSVSVLLLGISLVFLVSAISARYDIPGAAAYAQGAFGRKNTGGGTDDQAAKDAQLKAEAEARKKADDERLAAEARKKAEDEGIAAEARKKAEADKIAADARKKAEDEKLAAESRKKAEDERLAAEARKKADDQRLAAESRKKAEDERLAAEARKKADDERLAADARKKVDDDRLAAEAKKRADDARAAAEAAKAVAESRHPGGDVIKPTTSVHTDSSKTYPDGGRVGNTGKYTRVDERPKPPIPPRPVEPPIIVASPPPTVVVIENPTPPVIYVPAPTPVEPPSVPAPPVPVVPSVPSIPDVPAVTLPPADVVPAPASAGEAVLLMCRAWREGNAKLLAPLLPKDRNISIAAGTGSGNMMKHGEFYSLSAADFYSVTARAMDETKTVEFSIKEISASENKVIWGGVHAYTRGTDPVRRVSVRCTLERIDGRWFITAVESIAPAPSLKPAVLDKASTDALAMLLATKVAPVSVLRLVPVPSAGASAAMVLARPRFSGYPAAKMAEKPSR